MMTPLAEVPNWPGCAGAKAPVSNHRVTLRWSLGRFGLRRISGRRVTFGAVRLGVLPGADIGLRVGLGTLLGDLNYTIPFVWERASFAVALGGGANFNQRVGQLYAPLAFTYRFNRWLALSASQATAIYVGQYSGWSVVGGAGLKLSLGPFFLYPKFVGGYLAPSGGVWTRPGSGIVSSYIIAEEGPVGSFGLAMGFDF